MLKILKLVALIFAVLASCLTAGLIVLSIQDNSKVTAFLRAPGVFEKMGINAGAADDQKDMTPPLVVQARAFALRIDPPIPQETKTLTRIPEDQENQTNPDGKGSESDTTIIISDPPPLPRFDLLATVRYELAPEKSLALFQTGGRQEWFYKGQTVGRHTIADIKDGRVTLIQSGRQPQEVSVPPKSNSPPLLKGG